MFWFIASAFAQPPRRPIPPFPRLVPQVIVTIIGTVSYGFDTTGVFGPANTPLQQGQPFILTFTYDTTKGAEAVTPCADGDLCGSSVSGCQSVITGECEALNMGNPGIAVLQIGSGSWSWGVLPINTILSDAARSIPPPGGPQLGFGQVSFNVYEWYNLRSSEIGSGGSSSVQVIIYPAANTPPLSANYDWRTAFTRFSGLYVSTIPFGIDEHISAMVTVNSHFSRPTEGLRRRV